jgi:hypothetical protein
MVKTLELAISKAAELPEAAQEELGRAMLRWIRSRARLVADLDVGVRQLDAGHAREINIEAFLRKARGRYSLERRARKASR